METKISLVPTRTLFPQAKKDKKNKPTKNTSTTPESPKKVYNEKNSSSNATRESELSTRADSEGSDHTFLCDFPRLSDYSNIDKVAQTFPRLNEANKSTFQVEALNDLKCFIMRSNNEDDIHKAIKYGIWTSTSRSNEFLNSIYKECTTKGTPVFLLYSVVRSGQFSAVAQLSSEIQEKHFQFWWEDQKWMNHFEVKWIFIKDLPYKCFNHLSMDDNTPVIRARDCTSIPVETAKNMLKIFRDYRSSTSIFDAFCYMDVREDMLRHYRYSIQAQQDRAANKKALKTTNGGQSSYTTPKLEPLDPFGMSLREVEMTLNFYQKEEEKMREEIEDILRVMNSSQQIMDEDFGDYLPDYQELRCKEKEMEEGLDDLHLKYQLVCRDFTETQDGANKGLTEKNTKKMQDLEKVYRNLRDSFSRNKENMSFFSRKILELNVTFYQYNF